MSAFVIHVDGRTSIQQATNFKDLQRCVGGCIEGLLYGWSSSLDFYVNEEGMIWNLPINKKITAFMNKIDGELSQSYRGDAVVINLDFEPLTENEINLLTQEFNK